MENKKEQIILAATKLFGERGFEMTSIAQVCAEAGVSKGLVFHHFKSKNELLREIFSATTARMSKMNGSSASQLPPRKHLINLIESLFSQLQTDKLYFQLNLNIMLQPGTRALLNDLIKERSSHLLASVREIFNNIDSQNAEVMSFVFIAELDGIALDYLTIFEDYPLDKIKQYLINKYE